MADAEPSNVEANQEPTGDELQYEQQPKLPGMAASALAGMQAGQHTEAALTAETAAAEPQVHLEPEAEAQAAVQELEGGAAEAADAGGEPSAQTENAADAEKAEPETAVGMEVEQPLAGEQQQIAVEEQPDVTEQPAAAEEQAAVVQQPAAAEQQTAGAGDGGDALDRGQGPPAEQAPVAMDTDAPAAAPPTAAGTLEQGAHGFTQRRQCAAGAACWTPHPSQPRGMHTHAPPRHPSFATLRCWRRHS